MKTIVIASTRESAGKTSIITGILAASGSRCGYIKPFGDRLIYRHKRNWDYDASLIIDIFKLNEEAENITLGFDHSKLRYVYDEESIKKTLKQMVSTVGKGKDFVFAEGGKDIFHGSSLHLDSLSVVEYLEAKLVLVVSGDNDTVLDDLHFVKRHIECMGINFGGVIINKIQDHDEFENVYLKEIKDMKIPILGIIPSKTQLTHFTINYLAEKLYAKVIAGDKGINNVVKNIFVGAMSLDESLRNPLFNKEHKFLITSGDRSDMILAALDSDTKGILLTNNILPPSHIIAKADDKNIPLLLLTMDTYEATKQIDKMEALLTADNTERIQMLGQLIAKYCKIDEITR